MFNNLNNPQNDSLTDKEPEAGPGNEAGQVGEASNVNPPRSSLAESAQSNKKEVDDIFSETDKVDNAGVFSQARPKIEAQTVGLGALAREDADLENHKSGGSKLLRRLLTIFIILGILGAAAYFIYVSLANRPTDVDLVTPAPVVPAPVVPNPTPIVPEPIVDETPSSTPLIDEDLVEEPEEPNVLDLSLIDTDDDGLSDADEELAGSNPNLIDTDNDGLSDYEEVEIYKTNPLSPDSDSDGYDDGTEVRGGYNPNGTGRLNSEL